MASFTHTPTQYHVHDICNVCTALVAKIIVSIVSKSNHMFEPLVICCCHKQHGLWLSVCVCVFALQRQLLLQPSRIVIDLVSELQKAESVL